MNKFIRNIYKLVYHNHPSILETSKSTPTPLVSIISVNYGQTELTLEMIASLNKITYPAIEIIIVDNGSPSSCKNEVTKNYPKTIVIESPHNLGFAGGNNLGIREAKGKYLLFLNNDTEVEPDFLEPLISLAESNPSIGVITPKLKFYFSENKNIIQWAGSSGLSLTTVRGKSRGDFEEDKGQYDEIIPTQLIHGAAMLVPMDVIWKAGLMPDIYFLYYEELDWAEAIKKAGYALYYNGFSTVYHKESMSVGKNSPLKIYYMTRGRLIFTRRNRNGLKFLMGFLFFLFLAIPKNILKMVSNKEWKQAKAFLQGVGWHISGADVNITPKLKKASNGSLEIIDSTYQLVKKF
ncbi:MAG: glycosyltransferase family 2 protein [Mongoliitalea sp.]